MNKPTFSLKTGELDPADFVRLIESAGWGSPNIEQAAVALRNSVEVFSIQADGRTVGMGRLLGDGGLWYFIKDVIILPEYQGFGAGTMLMKAIIADIGRRHPGGWSGPLELMSARGKENFYRKFGFSTRSELGYGEGMLRRVYGGVEERTT